MNLFNINQLLNIVILIIESGLSPLMFYLKDYMPPLSNFCVSSISNFIGKHFWIYFSINEFNLKYAEWFNNFLYYLNIFTVHLQKENNIFAFLDNSYILDLPNFTIIEKVFLTAQSFCSPFIKGEVPLPSEIESLVYTRMALSECILKVSYEIINFIYPKDLNINLALSKTLENSSANVNVGKSWNWKWIVGGIAITFVVIGILIRILKGKGSSPSDLGQQSLTSLVDSTKKVENKIQSLELQTNIAVEVIPDTQTAIIQNLRADIVAKVAENANLTDRVQSLESDVIAKVAENTGLTDKVQGLKRDFVATVLENTALINKVQSLERDVVAKNVENEQLTSLCSHWLKKFDNMSKKFDDMSEKFLDVNDYVEFMMDIFHRVNKDDGSLVLQGEEFEKLNKFIKYYNEKVFPVLTDLVAVLPESPPPPL